MKKDFKILKGLSKEKQDKAFNKMKPDDLLLEASECGNLKWVKEALKRGANIHAEDDYAIVDAAVNGHLEVVKYLLDAGINILSWTNEILRLASNNGHLEVVKFIYDNDNIEYKSYGVILEGAASDGHCNILNWILDKGVDISNNIEKEYHKISIKKNTELKAMALLNIMAVNQMLVSAVENSQFKALKLLLERGAKVTDETMEIAEEKKDADIIKLLNQYA